LVNCRAGYSKISRIRRSNRDLTSVEKQLRPPAGYVLRQFEFGFLGTGPYPWISDLAGDELQHVLNVERINTLIAPIRPYRIKIRRSGAKPVFLGTAAVPSRNWRPVSPFATDRVNVLLAADFRLRKQQPLACGRKPRRGERGGADGGGWPPVRSGAVDRFLKRWSLRSARAGGKRQKTCEVALGGFGALRAGRRGRAFDAEFSSLGFS